MSNYRLTLAAEIDLADILEYGEAHFGTSAALEFYEGLHPIEDIRVVLLTVKVVPFSNADTFTLGRMFRTYSGHLIFPK